MCNSLDAIGCDWSNSNRKGLSIFNFVLIFIGFVCGCVAAAGAFRSEDIIHALPWMTYTLANYTLSGYVDVNGTKVPEYVANRPTNPETYYANLWGCTDDGKNAKLQWKDYPAVNDVCSDSYVPMLWGVGGGLVLTLVTMILTFTRMDPHSDKTKCWCVFFGLLAIIWNMSFFLGVWGRCFHSVYDRDMHPHFGVGAYAYMILIILANWPNFIIHLIIPVYDEDLHGSQEENKPLSSDVENPAPPPAKKSSGKTRSPGTKSSSGTKKKKTPGGKTGKSSGALSGSQSKAPNGSGTGTEVPAPPPHSPL
jgi:hypothetical protein